jgi:autotransporter translocation and assembly factor TamB
MQWNADVVVDRGVVKITKTSGEKLKPAQLPDDLTIGAPKQLTKVTPASGGTPDKPMAPPEKPAIVANITLRPTKVESKEVHTTISGKLVATADADSIGVVGTVGASSGDLTLFDRRYRIERAAVIFDGTIDPRLDVRITHDFPEVTTVTVVRNRLSKPELVLSSNPGTYSQAQLLGFLLGGEPNGDPNSGSARDKATSTGTSLVANAIGGYVRRALPFDIDVLRYEAATVSSSAAITVGTWLTHALFFAFRQRIDARPDENSGEGTLEYWLNQQLKVQGTAGDRGYDGVDVLWRKRF